jgi:hypothetical protein
MFAARAHAFPADTQPTPELFADAIGKNVAIVDNMDEIVLYSQLSDEIEVLQWRYLSRAVNAAKSEED